MNIEKVINGELLHRLLISGFEYLNSNISYLNEINVFPVADGDTGNNLKRTYEAGVNELKLNASFSEVLSSFVQGVLLCSRGNSGMILSQYFWGVYDCVKGKDNVSVGDFLNALENGYKTACKAVLWPVEGTILTVMRESVENISKQINADTSIEQFFDILTGEIYICVQNTPEKLEILRSNNVVDSGAAGFYLIFQGMKNGLHNKGMKNGLHNISTAKNIKESFPVKNERAQLESLIYRYCTEFSIKLNELNSKEFFAGLVKEKGDSLIISVQDNILKIHIHTNEPQEVLDIFSKFGEYIDTKIDDMLLQQELNNYNILDRKHPGYIIISFAHSEGIIELFKELGCDIVFTVPQNYKIAKDSFRFFIDKFVNEKIIILPNDEEIYKMALQLYPDSKYPDIYVIDSQNIIKSYFLLSLMVGTDSIDKILETFSDYVKLKFFITKILSITVKNEKYYAGFIDDEKIINKSLKDLLKIILTKQRLGQASTFVVFYGQTVSDEEIENIYSFFDDYSDFEFAALDGKLEDFDFIIGAM